MDVMNLRHPRTDSTTADRGAGLVVAGVSQGYNSVSGDVLNGLDLHVERGEMVALVGPSGSGKTTILRIIAGLERARSGKVTFDGRPLRRGDLGYVFQRPILFPHLSVRENILFSTGLKRHRAVDNAHYENLLRLLDIAPLEHRRVHELSGGQAQRVGIARGLIRQPPVVLFDEPLSSVDASLARAIRHDIAALHRELGFTGIYVTHQLNEAFELGQRIAFLGSGRVAQLGTPREVLAAPGTVDIAELTSAPMLNRIEVGEQLTLAVRATALSRVDPSLGDNTVLPVAVQREQMMQEGILMRGTVLRDTEVTATNGERVRVPGGAPVHWLTWEKLHSGEEISLRAEQTDWLLYDHRGRLRI